MMRLTRFKTLSIKSVRYVLCKVPVLACAKKKAAASKLCPHTRQLQLTPLRRAGTAGRHVRSTDQLATQDLWRVRGSKQAAHSVNVIDQTRYVRQSLQPFELGFSEWHCSRSTH